LLKLLEIKKKHYGEINNEYIKTLLNLSIILRELKEYKEAKKYLQKILDIQK
jgi:tetratricopeptide (TPR) repeat protein